MALQSPDERKNVCRWVSLALIILILLLGIMYVRSKAPHKRGAENIAKMPQPEYAELLKAGLRL